MRKIALLCSIFVITFSSFSQGIKPKERIENHKQRGALFQSVELFDADTDRTLNGVPEEFKDYSCFALNQDVFQQVRSQQPDAISMTLPIHDRGEVKLELVKSIFKTSDYQITEMPSGKPVKGIQQNAHYIGIVEGNESSLVAISLLEGEVMGFISYPEQKGNLVIGKMLDSEKYLIYNDLDLDQDARSSLMCQTADLNVPIKEYDKDMLMDNQEKAIAKCPRIFFDLSSVFVNNQGGTTSAANYLDGVFAQVVALYANENINLLTSGSAVWTSSQPFANDLSSYTNYRNTYGFNGDLGHLIVASGGGVAYLGGVCSSVYNYGLSGIYGAYYSIPTYSWSVSVIAHELGHNFGSNHTHACVWNGNYTAIDGCYNMEGNCGYPGVPSNGGTIMSYCHLTNIGINMSYGFGTQPGNVIRNVIAGSQCLTTCNGDDNTDLCATSQPFQSGVNYSNGDYVTYNGNLFQMQNWDWQYIKACDTGSDLCSTSPQWVSGATYAAGAYVVFSGYLYQFDGVNWNVIQECNSSGTPCSTAPIWQSGVTYNSGDYVRYNNDLYQYNGVDWDYIQSCTSSTYAMPGDLEKKEMEVSIYPNPLTDNVLNIFVAGEEITQYSVYSQDGKLIKHGELNNGRILFNSLERGLYLIELTTTKRETIQKKFVKN